MAVRRAKQPTASETPRVTDPFAVIPIQPENVERKQDSRGMIHLRLNAKPKGLKQKIIDWVGYDYTRKLELDENGTFYYNLVDGQTTLATIVAKFAAKLGTAQEETEGMVVLFTKKLMAMNMLALKVPEGATSRRSDE